MEQAPESSKIRLERYNIAKNEYEYVSSRLEDLYNYYAPLRTSFEKVDGMASDRGSSRTNTLYDATPQECVVAYANNLQSALMPPEKRWYDLEPSANILNKYSKDHSIIAEFKKELDARKEALFSVLTASNINLASNEAFNDVCISTGVIFLNERSDNPNTVSFTSVPPNTIYFSEDPYNVKLQNFWQDRKIPARNILYLWPDAQLTASLQRTLSTSPETVVGLVEGCIYYPDNPKDKYFYYVQDVEKHEDIVARWLPYCPYTGFRAYKRSGETWGRGVADRMFPFAKLLNKMAEYSIKAVKFHAFPAVGVVNSSPGFNANTVRIEPGSVVNMPMPNALQRLDMSGNPQPLYLERNTIVDAMRKAFFTDPLGEVQDTTNRTATEMQIRQQNWLRNNSVSTGRLIQEAITPLLQKTLMAMRRKGLITDPLLDGHPVELGKDTDLYQISVESPLVGIQKQDDAKALDGYLSRLVQLYGANTMAILNNEKIPSWYAEKLDVPLDLIKNEDQILQIVDQVTQTLDDNKDQLAQQKLSEMSQQQPQAPTPDSVSKRLQDLGL